VLGDGEHPERRRLSCRINRIQPPFTRKTLIQKLDAWGLSLRSAA
jgi:hypothetical protein